MRRRPLLWGALILMASGAVTRAAGTVYRILIVRWAGAEALGLFQMVLPLFRLASAMATLRLPVALTRVTADGLARGDIPAVATARQATAALIIVLTALTALAVAAGAPFLAREYLTDPRTEPLILLLPVAFVPSALTGIFRGYAEGRQNMISTAAGQVVEQLVRVPAVLLLLSWWVGAGPQQAAVALVLGLGAGELAGLLTAMVASGWWQLEKKDGSGRTKLRGRPRAPRFIVLDHIRTARNLLGMSLPLWAATVINTAAQIVNVGMIPRRLLAAGATMTEATALYGQLTGMVLPLLYMPMLLVFPVATVLTPAIAESQAVGNKASARRHFRLAAGGALAVGLATFAVCQAFPEAVPRLLYGIPDIAPLVRLVGVAAPFAFTANIFASVLYALGRTDVVLKTFVITTAIRLALIYWLTADPRLGIGGALWAIVVDYALTAAANGRMCARLLR
ncbi:MAG: oligosaccharide flippase family protein [Firmicutes bacterium]|nr:oligosaccharide flippase family protein [Bacillota bacterium]